MSQAGRNLNGALASLAGIAVVCATLSVPAPAWAAYDAKSTDGDVLKSCKDFSIDSSGVMSANCNEWDNDKVQSVEARTIDLDEKVGADAGGLVYDSSNFSDKCSDLTIAVRFGKLNLQAVCGEVRTGIFLNDRITNVGYGGTDGDPGLYWTDAVTSTGKSAQEGGN